MIKTIDKVYKGEEYRYKRSNPIIHYNEDFYKNNIEPYLGDQANIYINEIWVQITDEMVPGVKPHYSISNYGRVFSTFSNRLLTVGPSGKDRDYAGVGISVDGRSFHTGLHRLMMLVFNYFPGCHSYEANHKNRVKLDNYIENLEWNTRSENVQHAYNNDLNHRGENHYSSVYTEEQVHLICHGLADGLKYEDIAAIAGLEFTPTVNKFISEIRVGRLWKHISKNYVFHIGRSNQSFSDDQIRKMCEGLQAKLTTSQIMASVGIDYDNESQVQKNLRRIFLNNIKKRKRFKHISKDYNFE